MLRDCRRDRFGGVGRAVRAIVGGREVVSETALILFEQASSRRAVAVAGRSAAEPDHLVPAAILAAPVLRLCCVCQRSTGMASDSDDEPVVEGVGGVLPRAAAPGASDRCAAAGPPLSRPAKRARSTKLLASVMRSGPLQCVAVVGVGGATRWMRPEHLSPGTPLFNILRSKLLAIGSPDLRDGPAQACGDQHLVGFVLMEAWRFEYDFPAVPAATSVREQLIAALMKDRRRSQGPVGVFSYPIVACAALLEPLLILGCADLALATPEFGQQVCGVF